MEIKTLDDLHDDDVDITPAGGDDKPGTDKDLRKNEKDDNGYDGAGDSGDGASNDDGSGDDGTPIEQFLSQYGILGGMVSFEGENGAVEERHYDELTPEEQFNVLTNLATQAKTTEEEKYSLTNEEIALINKGRKEGKSVQQSIIELAEQRAEEILAFKQAATLDFKDMDDDAIYLRYLKAANPEADANTLQSDLELAKQLSTYKNNVAAVRTQFEREQELENIKAYQDQHEANMAQIEADRHKIVEAVAPMDNIAGWDLTNEDKNQILEQLLEVDEKYDSLFVNEVFSDPKKMFKAAWMYNNAEEKFDQMANYYKGEINKAYLKGKSDALSGENSNGGSRNMVDKSKGGTDPVQKRSNVSARTLDELHDDD